MGEPAGEPLRSDVARVETGSGAGVRANLYRMVSA